MIKKIIFTILFIGLTSTFSDIYAQPLQIVVEPIFPDTQAKTVYAPLIEYLSNSIDREIQLITPSSFREHWKDTRSNTAYDLAIASAPITDFRIQQQGYVPLVRKAKNISYSLVTLDPDISDSDELLGHLVSIVQSPSVSYLLITRWYNNPLSQPKLNSNAPTWNDSINQLFAAEVDGILIPSRVAAQYPQFNIVRTSQEIPGFAISASAELDSALKEQIKQALLALNEDDIYYDLLQELETESFIGATADEYNGYINWLKPISLGGF